MSKVPPVKLSLSNAEHYKWGNINDGWFLLKNDELTVIEERIAPGSSERLHFHTRTRQLFYILSGEAVFEIGEQVIQLSLGESIHVPPGEPHKISNKTVQDLRFIVISCPDSHGDRSDL